MTVHGSLSCDLLRLCGRLPPCPHARRIRHIVLFQNSFNTAIKVELAPTLSFQGLGFSACHFIRPMDTLEIRGETIGGSAPELFHSRMLGLEAVHPESRPNPLSHVP